MAHQDEQIHDYYPYDDVGFMDDTMAGLRQANQMLRETLECTSEMIAVQDTASRYLTFNSAYHAEFQKIFGVDLKIGTNMVEALTPLPEEQNAATEIFERMIGGEAFTVVHEFGDPHLARRFYELHCFPLRDSAGRVIGGTHIARDVTEQRRTTEALLASEENYRRMIDSSPDCIKMLDLGGQVLSINPAGLCLMELGEDPGPYLGSSWLDYWQGNARHLAATALECARAGGVGHFRAPGTTAKGNLKWWDETLCPMLDASGQTERLLVVARDVTQQKLAEDELRRSEAEFRTFFESSGGGKAQADAVTGRFLRVNGKLCELTGYTKEELLGMTLTDLLPPEDRERQLELFRQARDNTAAEYSVEKRYRRRDGTVLWVQATVGFLRDERGRAYRALAIVQDITPLKRIEQDLRSSEERFRRLVETSTVGLGICDTHGKVFYANQAILTMLGFTAEEVPQVNWIDLTPSEYLPRDLQTIEQLRATGTCTPYEKQLIAQDGRRVPVLLGVSMIDQDDVGDPIGACFVTDLTRLKEAEAERERLLEAQRVALEQLERFRIALDSAADYIFLIDPQTLRFLDVSQSACRALGYSREELLELGPREVMPQISEEEIRRRFAEIRSDPAGKGAIETLHYRKDGSCFEVEKILRPVEVRGRVLLVGVARDITERKQAEAALRAANAQLAEADRRKNEFLAMLAHELRNPLAPIRNAMQVLRLIDLNEPAQKRQGDIIDRQITHMARLVNDLLDVSRITRGKIELSRQPLALADVLPPAVETAMPMIETRHQTLTMSPPSPALRVLADLDRLAQVVGNLLTNAAKYTEEGGRIWLEAGREGGDAVIRVRDTGVGIAQELLPHIFDLFTQAEQSLARSQGGLGIGLTMVRSLVEMHGGSVEVHSAGLGQGSEFTIRLPALAA